MGLLSGGRLSRRSYYGVGTAVPAGVAQQTDRQTVPVKNYLDTTVPLRYTNSGTYKYSYIKLL